MLLIGCGAGGAKGWKVTTGNFLFSCLNGWKHPAARGVDGTQGRNTFPALSATIETAKWKYKRGDNWLRRHCWFTGDKRAVGDIGSSHSICVPCAWEFLSRVSSYWVLPSKRRQVIVLLRTEEFKVTCCLCRESCYIPGADTRPRKIENSPYLFRWTYFIIRI